MSTLLGSSNSSTHEAAPLRADEMRRNQESLIDDIIALQALNNPDGIRKDGDGVSTRVRLDGSFKTPTVEDAYWELEVKHRHGDSTLGKRQVVFHEMLEHDTGTAELTMISYGYKEVKDALVRRELDINGQRILGKADPHEERDLYLDLFIVVKSLESKQAQPQNTAHHLGARALEAA